MKRFIREHLRDFVAIALLAVVAAGISYVILQEQRLRIPVLETRPFELKAEMEDAQAVVAGQGQTIRVAGVKVGDVQKIELEDGKAIVTFGMLRDYLPVYQDATLLLRPKTGLRDMFFQLDPGTESAGVVEDGEMLALENTAPDVNLDEILEALDNDTQAYLRLLLVGAGRGLEGRGEDFGRLLGGLGPIQRDFRELNTEVAKRKENLRDLVTNFRSLTGEVAKSQTDLTELTEASATTLGAIGERDPDVQRAISVLPSTLQQTETTLRNVATFADVLGPTVNELRPFARNLPEVNASTRRLADNATPPIRDEIRPFVRQARGPVNDLRPAARQLARATPPLTTVSKKINRLGNMAAYNPKGAEGPTVAGRDEGYLFWAGWLGHNGNSIFETGDAHGFVRRIYLTLGCDEAQSLLAASPAAPAVTGLMGLFEGPGAVFGDACDQG